MGISKGAETIDEAVGQFFENPKKYSHTAAPIMSKEAQTQLFDPPPYAPPTSTVYRQQHRTHTNAVIEAGHVRSRDEVRIFLNPTMPRSI